MIDLTTTKRQRQAVVDCMDALYAFSRRFCRNTADADDLVQETLIRALANLEQLRDEAHLKSWLFTIMRNTFCTRLKTAQREALDLYYTDMRSLSVAQESRVHMEDLQIAIDKLAQHQREVVVLISIEGASYDEASEKLGCSVGTIKSRLNRARVRLAIDLGLVRQTAIGNQKKQAKRAPRRNRPAPPIVLIVEDEYLVGADLVDLIEHNGASALGPASTIPSALAFVTHSKIDAAVLDINIHNEMVFDVADALRNKRVPFLFTSGYDFSVVPERFRQVPRHQKPIHHHDFVRDLTGLIA